jgi:EmrB/QacA subfamily drug resistance transporter
MNDAHHPNGAAAVVPPALSEREKNVIIAGVLLSMLLAALDQTIVAPAMPTIGHALGHADYLPWIVTGYLLTATAMAPLYGKISDIYGRRTTIFAAIAIFLVGSLINALAPNMPTLIAGRLVQGLGGGGLFALTQTVIGDLVPPRERARYAAWISGTWAVASIAGPLLGGAFAEHLHWSLIFWINIPLGFVVVAIINRPLKKLPLPSRAHSIDAAGAALLVAATSVLLLALNWGGSRYAWLSLAILGLLALSALLWTAFAVRLRRAAEPLISLEVLADPVVRCGTLAIFLVQAANVGLSVYIPLYVQSFHGLSAADAGFTMVGILMGTVFGAVASGRTIPKAVHYKWIALAGALFSVLCLSILAFFAGQTSLPVFELLIFCVGFGTGMTFPVTTVSVQNAVDQAHLGVATGVLTFLRSLGGALGVAILGAIALGNGLPLVGEAVEASETGSLPATAFTYIFVACASSMALSLVLFHLMPERPLRGSVRDEPPVSME